jgi:Arc/MetJ family transcription regulator
MEGKASADVSRESYNANTRTMRTTIDIDDSLMRRAMRLSGLTTKKAVVEVALRLFVQTHSQASPLDVKGVKSDVSTTDLVAVVRKGRKRG